MLALTDDLTQFRDEHLQGDPELVAAARYTAGPPISEDDLKTLAGGRIGRRLSREVATRIASVLRLFWDPLRFPWLFENRRPTEEERENAIAWTAGLWAAEQLRTLRRTEARERQESMVIRVLTEVGFEERPKLKAVAALDEIPRGTFTREILLAGTKCDVPVRLLDGRLLALECKVSNSALNSVKRLVRETGGKAGRWHEAFGHQVITGAVLAGVFRLVNLKDAQDHSGVAIFWEHNMAPLREFVSSAK